MTTAPACETPEAAEGTPSAIILPFPVRHPRNELHWGRFVHRMAAASLTGLLVAALALGWGT